VKRRRCKYIGEVRYSNGFFKCGVIKNPHKADVIRVWTRFKEQKDKDSISIHEDKQDFAVDEAIAVSFLLQKAVMHYIFKNKNDIRDWEKK